MSEISKQALKVDNSQSFPDNNAGAITPSDLRAFNTNMIDSLVDEITFNAFSSSVTSSIEQLSAFTASQQPAFNALNAFTASQLTINTGYNAATHSLNASVTSLNSEVLGIQIWTASVNEISFNSGIPNYATRWNFGGFISASFVENVGGRIADITVLQDPTKLNTSSFNDYTASTAATQSIFSASVATSISQSSATFTAFSQSQNSFNQSATASLVELLSLSSSLSGGYATQGELDAVSASQSLLNVTFATTGSNTFRGNETFEDTAGNASTLVPTSGSLMLVAKTFTSASSHLTASAGDKVNLIFKSNNNTTDTIISGSDNIFPNPAASLTGFKRYIGGSNNIFTSTGIPSISASMEFSPSMNRNVGSFGAPLRGPVSSSTWTINDNYIGGGLVNFGTAAAPMTHAVAGYSFNYNALFGGTINMTANKTLLDTTPNISSNIIFGATANLNHNSSSLNYTSNIQNGGITINNNYTPTVGSVNPRRSVGATINTVYGVNHLVNVGGTNTSTGVIRHLTANLLAGTYVTASLQDTGDNTSMIATNLMGNALIVSGTAASPTGPTPAADATYGTVIVGRFNSTDGNKAKSAETAFAVGTGTGYTNRKTGFLIDSGSNTFIEGTLNVSGSTTISGSITITGSAYGNVVPLSISSQTASMDLSLGNFFTLTLVSGSTTQLAASNIKAGQTINLLVTQATDGSGILSYNSTFKFTPGNQYTASVSSSSKDILTFITFDDSNIYASAIKNLV